MTRVLRLLAVPCLLVPALVRAAAPSSTLSEPAARPAGFEVTPPPAGTSRDVLTPPESHSNMPVMKPGGEVEAKIDELLKGLSATTLFGSTLSASALMEAFLSSTAHGPALRSASEPAVPEVVVTASRIPAPVAETPDSVSVVTPADMRANNARDLGGAIQRVPGVDVARYGGAGSLTGVTVRGSRAGQVLVMQDGRPLNRLAAGDADGSMWLPAAMDRVEVVRGPSALLYGSSALGGAVNVMTPRPPERFEGALDAQGGTWDTRVRRARVGGPVGPTRWLFVQEGLQADGARANSAFRGDSFFLKGEAGSTHRVTLTGGAWNGDVGVPGVRPAELSASRWPDQGRFGTDEVASLVDRQQDGIRYLDVRVDLAPAADHDLTLRHYTEFGSQTYRRGSVPYFGNPAINTTFTDNDIQGAEAQYTARNWPGAGGRIAVGGTWRKERMRSAADSWDTVSAVLTPRQETMRARVETAGEFIEVAVRPLASCGDRPWGGWLQGVTLAGGARHDQHSIFGSILNQHAGVAVPVGPATVKASLGSAYRAPSFNDLFWPNAGNPDLRPERGQIAEGAVEARWRGLTGRLGAYQRTIRDQIDWAPDATGNWKPRNVGLVETTGVEVEAGWAWKWLTTSASIATIDADQRQEEIVEYDPITYAPAVTEIRERTAAHVPSWVFGAAIAAELPSRTGVSLAARGAGERFMYLEDTSLTFPRTATLTKRLAPFAVVTARVSQRVGKGIEVYAGAENLMDAKYAMRFGNDAYDRNYPAPGRSYFLGASATW